MRKASLNGRACRFMLPMFGRLDANSNIIRSVHRGLNKPLDEGAKAQASGKRGEPFVPKSSAILIKSGPQGSATTWLPEFDGEGGSQATIRFTI